MSKNVANAETSTKRTAKKNTKQAGAEQTQAPVANVEAEQVQPPQQKRGGRAKKQAAPAEQPAQVAEQANTTVKVVRKNAKAQGKAPGKAPANTSTKGQTKATSKSQSKGATKETASTKGQSRSKKVQKDAPVENVEAEATETTENGETSDSKFEKLIVSLAETRKNISELQKQEKLLIKKLSNVHNSELKRASKRKRKANANPTGFATEKEIGGKLADWLRVDRGSKMTGPDLSKAFWARIKEEGLQYGENKRVLRTNKEVSSIFGVDAKVNKSVDPQDENGFNMRTYQTHIAYALEHSNN